MKEVKPNKNNLTKERAAAIKKALNLTFRKLAQKLDLSESTVRNVAEQGIISPATAAAFANHFGAIPEYWQGLTECRTVAEYEIEKAEAEGLAEYSKEHRAAQSRTEGAFEFFGFSYSYNSAVDDYLGILEADGKPIPNNVKLPCVLKSKNDPAITADFSTDELRDIIKKITCLLEMECYKKMVKSNQDAAAK